MIEISLVLTVIAILTTLSVPMLSSMSQSAQVAKIEKALISALRIAKSEAITLGNRIDICPKQANSTACVVSPTNDWSNGWIVKNQLSKDIVRVFNIKTKFKIYRNGTQVTSWSVNPNSKNIHGVTYSLSTYTICDPNNNNAIASVVINQGRARTDSADRIC